MKLSNVHIKIKRKDITVQLSGNKMSLGENLQFLRKRDNITQEQLAEKLDVSRQSVSKWESDSTYPEMDKLIQLCQMFHCTMDDLLQKDISTLYVEDKSHYDSHMNLLSKMTALGVGLILLGLSSMMLLQGIFLGKNEELYAIPFFIFLIIAVSIFIVMGLQHSNFEKKNPYIENFYNENEIDEFNKKFTIMITSGVVLILISLVILIGFEAIIPKLYTQNPSIDYDSVICSFFLFMIAIAVTIMVYAGIQKTKYNINEYNLSHDKDSETYKKNQLTGTICGCLMLIATIIYLLFGFILNGWGMPYVIVYPVFGIACGIVSIIIDAKYRK